MTNGLLIFLALYILVWQPAIVWWMTSNPELYQLAWLNAWIFVIARIISAICKPNKWEKADKVKLIERTEEKISRVESDSGVAVVEVEKKEETIVETDKEENQEEVENSNLGDVEEKLEDKSESKKKDKTMKEAVSIPKIVQPIAWHTSSNKRRKKETKWGQWLILFLTLGVAALIVCTLWEFLWCWWLAIALFLWWILYLIIGKLFDVNWFYNAKKLFTNWLYIVLILAWIGYGVYSIQQEDGEFKLLPEWWSDKVITYVKDLFNSKEKNTSIVDTWAVYVFEWTWEVISNSWDDVGVLDTSAENVDMGDTQNDENIKGDDNEEDVLTPEEAKKQVTMWEAIKSLLEWTTLSTKTNSTFKYVSKSNALYPYFKTAQEKWMIGSDTDPSKIVSCETYITMKWLAEWWNVWSYVKSEIKSAYWKKASELWELNWCTKWSYVTKANL